MLYAPKMFFAGQEHMHAAAVVALVLALVVALAALATPRRPPPAPPSPPTGAPVSLVINLRKNAGRLKRFEDGYVRGDLAGVPLRRVDAVVGADLDDAELRRLLTPAALTRLDRMRESGVRQAHPDLTPGAVGCYLSHMRAWRQLLDAGAPYAFVFEDDASLPRRTLSRFDAACRQIPRDWDVVLLGYDAISTPLGRHACEVSSFLRLHAYAISAAGARKLLGSMLPMSRQVDWEVSGRIKLGQLRVYGVVPTTVSVNHQGTDIQSPMAPTVEAAVVLTDLLHADAGHADDGHADAGQDG